MISENDLTINESNLVPFLQQRNGVLALRMKDLKPLAHYRRFKVKVVQELEDDLECKGVSFLASYDNSLPKNQNELVVLYLKDHPIAPMLDALKKACINRKTTNNID